MEKRSVGIVRQLDELGRVVIPKEIRDEFGIREGDSLEVLISNQNEIVFQVYRPGCYFGCGLAEDMVYFKRKLVCPSCKQQLQSMYRDRQSAWSDHRDAPPQAQS